MITVDGNDAEMQWKEFRTRVKMIDLEREREERFEREKSKRKGMSLMESEKVLGTLQLFCHRLQFFSLSALVCLFA